MKNSDNNRLQKDKYLLFTHLIRLNTSYSLQTDQFSSKSKERLRKSKFVLCILYIFFFNSEIFSLFLFLFFVSVKHTHPPTNKNSFCGVSCKLSKYHKVDKDAKCMCNSCCARPNGSNVRYIIQLGKERSYKKCYNWKRKNIYE